MSQLIPTKGDLNSRACLAVGSEAPKVTFGAGYELGTLGFYLGNDDSRAYYSGNYNDGYVNAGGSMANANKGYDWTIEEVTWLPVAMKAEIGYATLYSPVQLELSFNRVKAYTGTVDGDWLILHEQTTAVPANQGVVLVLQEGKENEVEDEYVFLQVQETKVTVEDNDFRGTHATQKANNLPDEGTIYTLQPYSKEDYALPVAFMEYYDEENENIPNLKGFRAYLPLNGSSANSISIRFEGTTDIEHSEIRNQKSEMIFDLLGRRVEAITKGGIYIVNGKKVVVK